MREIKINEIEGVKIGHAQHDAGGTGCSVVICEKGGVAGVDVRGGAPATRETNALDPVNLVETIHGVVLSGGSAYGLDAASGVMAYLEEKKVGFDVQVGVVPIVCGASLFDLVVGDPKIRPDKEMGYAACVNAEKNLILEGNIGAGTGASVGKILGIDRAMKSGLGVFAAEVGDLKVGAIVAVNALGNIVDEKGEFIAGVLDEQKKQIINAEQALCGLHTKDANLFSGNTTIGVIITNGKMTKSMATKVASMAHDGYARSIHPVHTMNDGDTIFTLGTGEVEANLDIMGVLAGKVMEKAIIRAGIKAQGAYGLKSYHDI